MPPAKPVRTAQSTKQLATANDAPPLEFIATDVAEPKYKMLGYGHNKTGKTHLFGQAHMVEGMGPELAVCFGEGYNTLVGEPRFAGIQIVKPRSLDELSNLYNWLRPDWDNDRTGKNKLAEYGWQTILLDEADRMIELFMRERMREVIAEKPNREEDKPALDDYGIVRNQTLKVIDWFLALPVHVLMTGWAERAKDPMDQREYIMPSFPGKLANEIPGRFGIVTYLEYNTPRRRKLTTGDDANGTRLAHFEASNAFIAGVWGETRLQRLGAEMENPTMQEIFNRLQGD